MEKNKKNVIIIGIIIVVFIICFIVVKLKSDTQITNDTNNNIEQTTVKDKEKNENSINTKQNLNITQVTNDDDYNLPTADEVEDQNNIISIPTKEIEESIPTK